MGFEIPLDCDYPEHPKAIKIIALLGKRSDIFPLRLFCWAAKFAKSGVIDGGAAEIEAACKWDGEPGVLHDALIKVGILEDDGVTIHDWHEYAGRKLAAYLKKKTANKDAYKRKATIQTDESKIQLSESRKNLAESRNSDAESASILPDFGGGASINETKRNETKRNETRPNETPRAAVSFSEKTVDSISEKAAFTQGKGTSPSAITAWHKHISDLVKAGFSLDFIEAEVDRPERFHSEPPWDFFKRLTAKSTTKTPEQEREERLAAEREYAKRLREQRKAQTG